MDPTVKHSLKVLIDNHERIPVRFWGDKYSTSHLPIETQVLWLQSDQSFGIQRDGTIHWRSRGKMKNSSWKTFWISKKKHVTLNMHNFNRIYFGYNLIVRRENIHGRDIIKCRNIDIRRFLINELGLERFVMDIGASVIDKDGDSELLLADIRETEPIVYVKVKDPSTNHWYFLRVPPSTRTCREGIAWTFGLTYEEYEPHYET